MTTQICNTLTLLALLAPPAAAQHPPRFERFVCETSHDVPGGPPRSIDYQMVEAPAGSRIEIGVLFLYTDHFTAPLARRRVADWVRYANSLFGAGTSGVRLKSVGVRAAPRNVSRAALAEDDPLWSVIGSLGSALRAVAGSHWQLSPIRSELGGDLVVVMAPSPWSGGIANVWFNDMSTAAFRALSYTVVGAAKRPAPWLLRAEGNALAHEVGHLLGLVHDRDSEVDPEAIAPFLFDPHAFGFLTPFETPDGRELVAGTVMAISGPKLAGFSRPRGSLPVVGYEDIVLDSGDATTNADRALRATAATVAGFYDAPPPDEDDEEEDDDDGGGFTPPRAAISTDAVCADGLCRALTGVPVRFEDASTGTVQQRSWDFGEGTSRNTTVNWSWSEPGFHEVTLQVSGGEDESTDFLLFLVEASEPAGTCTAGAERRCLQDSRFSVEAEWWTASGERAAGRVVRQGTNDSALFTFFADDNWEMLIKVLDGCALNGHVWVYGALTTDLGYSIVVTDTATGGVREYRKEPGSPALAIADATAFPEGCTP